MSLVAEVVDLVAARTDGRRVTGVRLRVGELTGVLPDALRFCFELATDGTPLAGATLELDVVPGVIVCRTCAVESTCADRIQLCPCGSADVAIVSGEDLTVAAVTVLHEEDACV